MYVYIKIDRYVSFYISGVLLVMIWFAISSISSHGQYPDENSFGLLIVFFCSLIAGKLMEVSKISSMPPLPPLLGKGIISFNFFLLISCKL